MRKMIPLLLLILALPSWAEAPTVGGWWRLHMTNGHWKKEVRLNLEQTGERLEGYLFDSSFSGGTKVQGKVDGDRVMVWCKVEDRAGNSAESTFRADLKDDQMVGTADYFSKRYEFTAERFEPEK
ncbi:MAG: hypothetical protein AB7S38_27090 [Vulcanimicrobiota bacterium]